MPLAISTGTKKFYVNVAISVSCLTFVVTCYYSDITEDSVLIEVPVKLFG